MTYKIAIVGKVGNFQVIVGKSVIDKDLFWNLLEEKIKEQLGPESFNKFDESYKIVKEHVEAFREVSILDKWFKIDKY